MTQRVRGQDRDVTQERLQGRIPANRQGSKDPPVKMTQTRHEDSKLPLPLHRKPTAGDCRPEDHGQDCASGCIPRGPGEGASFQPVKDQLLLWPGRVARGENW